jgi:paraquat-inducible protein B
MAENTDREAPPQATVVPRRHGRISVIWIIPIFAALVAIGIAVQRIMSEGPTITIVFQNAEGIEAGKTLIKYKDVNIGQVSAVTLSDDYTRVTVTAKIAKHAAGLMVKDARFWVVAPRIGLSGVSGLGTLLSGNYIGFEAGKSGESYRDFTALEVAPVVPSQQAGRQFVLQAVDLGSLGIGSPIYYRRLPAGQVISYDLAKDGKSIQIKVFVNAPFDKFVSAATRFWNASGFDVSVGAGGFDVRTQSLAALLAGGLAFDTPSFAQDTQPAPVDTVFDIYGDEMTAMKQPDRLTARYVLHFSEPLRGLSVGAPVTLLGLPAGTVTDVGFDFDPINKNIRGRVEVATYPERLNRRVDATRRAAGEAIMSSLSQRHALLRSLVEQRGLRAQLGTASLLTGQLYVAFDFFPKAPKAKIDWSKEPVELPVVPSPVLDIEQKLTSILAKVDAMPLEATGAELKASMVTLNKLLKDGDQTVNKINTDVMPELKPLVESLRSAADSADRVLKSTDSTLLGADAPAQQDLRNALQEMSRTAHSLRTLTDYLELHPEALVRGKTEEKR